MNLPTKLPSELPSMAMSSLAKSSVPIVIRFGRLGDMLLLAPLLNRLHRGYGNPCLLLGTGPHSAPLYAGHPDVARHRPLALSPQRWQMLQVLRAHRGAPVHVCETEPRALAKIRRMLALAQGPPERFVFVTDTPARVPCRPPATQPPRPCTRTPRSPAIGWPCCARAAGAANRSGWSSPSTS